MTREQKVKVLTRIVVIESDIETLQKVIRDLALNPYVSASLSSGGGSKSYTRRNISEIRDTIEMMREELIGLRRMLDGRSPASSGVIIQTWF